MYFESFRFIIMKTISINCDIGEGVGNEKDLLPFIQHCNIACGGHAGDTESMTEMVRLAIENKVLIGAHPSYPDRHNFGRKSLLIKDFELINSIRGQIDQLIKVAKINGVKLWHIKPHGALYNDIAKNESLAQVFIEAITPYKPDLTLFVPFNSAIEKLATKNDFSILYEAFADRNYNDDLSLVTRSEKNALIIDAQSVVKHIEEIVKAGKVNSVNNKKIEIRADTFCVHADTENAVSIVKEIHKLKN